MQIQTVDGSVINYTSIPPAQPTGPTAAISGPSQAETGQLLTFDGSGSTAGDTPIVRYDWNMGDGTILSGVSVQYVYNAPGSYSVQLTVTDQAGLSSVANQAVQVQAVVEVVPPTAVIEGPAAAFVGEQVTFSAANSTQGTAAISSYAWQSGDGNNAGPGSDNSFTTVYGQPGIYYPAVTVTDAGGLSDNASMAITVNANLEGTDWILSNTLPGTSISLQFANGNLSGFAGCNSYDASYTTTLAAGPTNSISVGPITTSQMACTPEILAQEGTYLTNLESASQYTISGATLTLTTAGGPLTYGAAVATPLPATQ
jgi:heat shock protein HslJ